MTPELSAQAQAALIGVGTNRQGATISPRTVEVVVWELTAAGLIGRDRGLTRRGTIVRERVMTAALDAAF